jgi:hypothetical protein
METATLTLNTSVLYLPYNPNNVNWIYDMNRQVIDTYGGRVVQVLSFTVQTMTVQGDAGSRPRLLQLYKEFKEMQNLQVSTKQTATLTIPAEFAEDKTITQNVWLENMDVGFSRETVTYPYRLVLEIDDVGSSFLTNTLKSAVIKADFNALGDGVGFVENGKYQGVNQTVNKVSVGQLSNLMYGQ